MERTVIKIVQRGGLVWVVPSPVTARELLVTKPLANVNVQQERWESTVRICVPRASGALAVRKAAHFVKMEASVTNTMGHAIVLQALWADCAKAHVPMDDSVKHVKRSVSVRTMPAVTQ